MNKINFTVLGNPKALKRHRTFTKDKHGNAFKFPMQVDPSKNEKKDFLVVSQRHAPARPFEVPLQLRVKCYFQRPKNHYRTGKLAGVLKEDAPVFHVKTPDADNLLKFVCDALNGVFFRDDSLIAHAVITKKFDESPRTEIELAPIN